MIQDKNLDAQVTGNLGGTKHVMGIAKEFEAHVMGMLSGMYSDPELANIREYSTNAHDAHIEAGITDPIHVTLPSPLSPFFEVRDFGIGLTEDDIARIYSQYGASTKRGTNTQNGTFGIGCKAALAYVQQFTVVSVKDGERIQVAISRESDGGSMTVVDRRQTDDPNGTTIKIPAKRDASGGYTSMIDRAKEFFSYWPTGTVLVNGKAPERVDGFWLTDSILVREASGYNRDRYGRIRPTHRVVMGNVAYPVEDGRLAVSVASGYEAVFFVPIGTVTIPPPREALEYSEKTLSALKQLDEDFKIEAKNAIQREVNSAKSAPEALVKLLTARKALADSRQYGSYTYKGKPLPSHWDVPGANTSYPFNYDDPAYRALIVPRDSYVQTRADAHFRVEVESFPDALWVVGYEGRKFSAPQKKKLLKFLTEEYKGGDESDIKRFILVKDDPAGAKEWVLPHRIVQWSDVNAVKLDRAQNPGYGSYKSIPGSYDNCIVDGQMVKELAANDIDQSKPIYWYSGSWYHASSYGDVLLKTVATGGCTIVPLPANRKDKFLRNFPAAIEATQAVKDAATAWAKTLTDEDRTALALADSGSRSGYKKFDPSDIKDPKIKEACKLARKDLTSIIDKRRMFQNVVGRIDGVVGSWKDPLKAYPLVDSYSFGRANAEEQKHIILYLNAAYKA